MSQQPTNQWLESYLVSVAVDRQVFSQTIASAVPACATKLAKPDSSPWREKCIDCEVLHGGVLAAECRFASA